MPYLMDDINAFGHEVLVTGLARRDPVLDVFPDMMRRIGAGPRFLLDEAAIHAAVELSLGRPKVLLESLQHIQVPYESMWIEWPEAGRQKLRDTFDTNPEQPGRPLPVRLGFLIEAERGGRKGVVTWVWNTPDDPDDPLRRRNRPSPVNVAPICPHFDLDGSTEQPAHQIEGFLRGNLAKLWDNSPVQLQALFDLWRTADHHPSNWGYHYLYALQQQDRAGYPERLAHCLADVYGEYIIIWSIMLLLTSSRKTVNYTEVDRSKLNKARNKRKEAPLFNHTVVTMHLNDNERLGQRRQPLGYQRKSPRVHLVSRYLNRRGDKHWVVEPFMRGSGERVGRIVHVKG